MLERLEGGSRKTGTTLARPRLARASATSNAQHSEILRALRNSVGAKRESDPELFPAGFAGNSARAARYAMFSIGLLGFIVWS
jgi:hypothetical protein